MVRSEHVSSLTGAAEAVGPLPVNVKHGETPQQYFSPHFSGLDVLLFDDWAAGLRNLILLQGETTSEVILTQLLVQK